MGQIHYNAWQLEFKRPFGALQAGNNVQFSVKVDCQSVTQVAVGVTKLDENTVFYPLTQDENEPGRYTGEIKITTSGLYHYYFRVRRENDTALYLGHLHGGTGKETTDISKVEPFQLTCYDRQVPRPEWYRNAVFYQIFPDRFANGNPHGEIDGKKPNTFLYGTTADRPMYIYDENHKIARWDFYGGNLRGIIAKLPYLKRLGVTALYLNPIFEAYSNHRYDTNDYLKIDPMLGTEEDFKTLITMLHENDMHLILDGVFNHVGKNSRYFNAGHLYGEQTGAANDKNSSYYEWFNFKHYPDQYDCWWGVDDLPTVNKDNPSYQQFIYGERGSVLTKWNDLGIDGWRLDVADELPDDFLRAIRRNLDRYDDRILIGEVWEDASSKVSYGHRRPYVSGDNLYGTMNYPLRQWVINFLQGHGELVKVGEDLLTLVENYPRNFLLDCLNNLGTHDTERILTVLNQSVPMVKIAFALLFNLPGIPCVYYGDEAGVEGGKDPDNRRYFPWGRENTELQKTVHYWSDIRQECEALKEGQTGVMVAGNEVLGLIRYTSDRATLLLVNRENQYALVRDLQFMHVPASLQQAIEKRVAGLRMAPFTTRFTELNVISVMADEDS
ncbi:glycoside hydrolase family 13 protein [uncultured Limosilactobacillus sp.]|uniref:glycoside hydrolase family 13 protein n=1 Tax=uncultured Limosilactobacillus sp. TaxID=2837629 RepID=UPI00259613B8|nr:glycoside hydrolase family 13 protein [uncultured Limosilactobacillus sp.]